MTEAPLNMHPNMQKQPAAPPAPILRTTWRPAICCSSRQLHGEAGCGLRAEAAKVVQLRHNVKIGPLDGWQNAGWRSLTRPLASHSAQAAGGQEAG